MDELHVAVGEDEAGSRPIGIVNRGAMAGWLAPIGCGRGSIGRGRACPAAAAAPR